MLTPRMPGVERNGTDLLVAQRYIIMCRWVINCQQWIDYYESLPYRLKLRVLDRDDKLFPLVLCKVEAMEH